MPDIFALTADRDFRRLEMRRDLQEQVGEMFQRGASGLWGPDLAAVPFERIAYRPDEMEVWRIPDFELPEHLMAAVHEPTECPPLPRNEYDGLRAIVCSFPDEELLLYQVIDRRKIISAEGFTLLLNDGVLRHVTEPGLQLSEVVHVGLRGRELRFKSDHWARRVVEVADHVLAATEEEVDAWVGRHDLEFEGDIAQYREDMSEWERKRIGVIQDSGILEQVGPAAVRERAVGYGLEIRIEGDGEAARLIIPSNKTERRELLWFLQEQYYQGVLTGTRYLSNSSRPLRREA